MAGLGVKDLAVKRFSLAQLAAAVMGSGVPQPRGEIGLPVLRFRQWFGHGSRQRREAGKTHTQRNRITSEVMRL